MKDIFSANQRIIVLQFCEKNLGVSNEMAQRVLKDYGHSLSIEQVNAVFIFLCERSLVKIEKLDTAINTIRVTRRGRDVALGNVREDGIDPPVDY